MSNRQEKEQHHRDLGLEQHADVVVLISEAKTDIETHLDLKLTAMTWRLTAMVLGGQVLAGAIAAVITRTTPAEAGRTAFAAILNLI